MARAGGAQVDVTIRIDRGEAGRLDAIVRALQAAGLEQVERHDRFLIVNGRIPADRLDALGRIEGVASVREDRSYRPQSR